MQPGNHLFTIALLLALSSNVLADNQTSGAQNPTINDSSRPRIGLVLSGGGARGFAHIGVLKVIEAMHVPIDVVVGTSMGSIIGGLYAIGLSPEDIENGVRDIDWNKVFNDNALRRYRSFRRKQDDFQFYNIHRIGISQNGLKLAPGLIEGQQIEIAHDRLAYPGFHITDFDKLAIPFRAVATDIETGEAVVLDHGNIASAMRASMSIPGALPPVIYDGKLLVDGGIGNNVPIDVARQMGADIIIVVDVSDPLLSKDKLESSADIIGQLTTIMTRRIADRQLSTLKSPDVLIVPGRKDITSTDFIYFADLIQAGIDAARQKQRELQGLALPPQAYADYKAALPVIARRKPIIDFIEIRNQTRLRDEAIATRIRQKTGEPLNLPRLEEDISIIYGLDLSSSVSYSLETRDDATGLIIHVRDRPWAPSYLQFGFTLKSALDASASSSSNIDISFTNPAIDSLGGEVRANAGIGSEPRAGVELYQPMDIGMNYFVSAKLAFETSLYPEVNAGHVNNLFRLQRNIADISAGKIYFGNTELRLGLRRASGNTLVMTGPASLPDPHFEEGGYYVRLLHDSLDNINWPNTGTLAELNWNANLEEMGADLDYEQLRLQLSGAGTWGRYTVYGRAILETTIDENAPNNALFRHGGFMELSGLLNKELAGQHFGLLEAAFYRRLGNITFLPMYFGFSVEAGNVWNKPDVVSIDNTLFAGSVFIGADTLIGPLYLAYGRTDTDQSAVYLYLGHRFTAF
jgi:NTE family protein